ncbi:MAG TPA: hypothetical protein VJV79_37640 [Polyangiaceae bacterium]|nr:hypothetical protein [Polyangiaceae bacterium]
MSVTLSEVKRAARAHRAPLAGESAGYLVLAIADQVLQAPRLVQAADIQLTEDGALRVVSGQASSDADAELSLRHTLDRLLLVASSGSAALTRASRRTQPLGLSLLVRELEAALIPVNRSAARRALARLHRETARALESGVLPDDEEQDASAPVAPLAVAELVAPPVVASLSAPVAAPPSVELRELNPEAELEAELEHELETPALPVAALPVIVESHLDGVVSALCEQLPAPPQFVESDPLTAALPVRSVSAPVASVAPEEEPEFLLNFEVEVEYETDAVDSSAAPTVMRAVAVAPVAVPSQDANSDQPLLDMPLEARTRPEPVLLRKTLRPLLELLPKPVTESEPLTQTPTLGSLATQLPILGPEQIAEMSVAASLAADLLQSSLEHEDRTERIPEVVPLSRGMATEAIVESKKSDLNELLSSFQVAEPDVNQGLCRALKQMADLDLTPAPFGALIR